MRNVTVLLLSLLFVLPLQAKSDPIRKKLEAMSPRQAERCRQRFDYVVLQRRKDHSPRTIAAVVPADEPTDDCSNQLSVFSVSAGDSLRRLAVDDDVDDPEKVELDDVTGDGIPEILVTEKLSGRYASVDILRWDGKQLIEIGETTDEALYLDLDHDGIDEIVTFDRAQENACGEMVIEPYLQRLQDGQFVADSDPTLASISVIEKSKAGPEPSELDESLPDNYATRCRFRIINGTRGGKRRATSVSMRVRPTEPDDAPAITVPIPLSGKDEYVDLAVDLPSRCTSLELTVDGPASATVAIVVHTTKVSAPAP